MRIGAPLAAGLVAAAVTFPVATAGAAPGVGARQTVEITYSTGAPGSPLGVTYKATIHNPSGMPQPPAVRRLLLASPEGARVDTSVPGRCEATDAELKQRGPAACPASSLIGHGSALTKPLGLPPIRFKATLFNARDQQVEVLEADPPTPRTVVRGYFRKDGTLDSPIPTCLNGGYAPGDCPFDQASLITNTLVTPAYSAGAGAARRSYFTTPPTCPRAGFWRSPSKFIYANGAETVTPTQPCQPAATRVAVSPRRPRRLSPTRVRVRVRARLGGRWVPLSGATVRLAGRKRRTDGRGRVSLRLRFRSLGRRTVRVSLAGYRSSRTTLHVARPRR